MTRQEPDKKGRIQQNHEQLTHSTAIRRLTDLIIFLDFDGVLNNDQFLRHQRNHPTETDRLFDPQNVGALNALCESVGVKSIIISSSWRQGRPLDELRAILVSEGFRYPELVSGTTPSTGSRAGDISAWLDVHHNKADPYLVIDDDARLLGSKLKVFKTNPYCGLRTADVNRILADLTLSVNKGDQ